MLDIYILKTCPYCTRVVDFLNDNSMAYNVHDISNEKVLNELMMIGGKEQVPYLFDAQNKIGMYESDNIINYLKTRKCK